MMVRRLSTRTDLARFIAAAAVIIWFGAFLYGSELRTYGLGVVVCVLLGAGVGWGWHYLVDSAGAAVVAASAPPPTGQDKSTTPSSNPPAPRQGPILDIPRSPDLSDVQQPTRTNLLRGEQDEKRASIRMRQCRRRRDQRRV